MPTLPPNPRLDALRSRARDLLRAARDGDARALARIAEVSGRTERVTLSLAQLALAREHGFPSWPALAAEVGRRELLDSGDAGALAGLLARRPEAAVAELRQWLDHPLGAAPLSYVAMQRYDTARGVWREVTGTGELARLLLAAGAPVDGAPDDSETPLMTAASYGDAEVARVLVAAGADLERTASPTAGGVPGGTALLHAAVFGMTAVVDVLAAAGARVPDVVQAAAVGDLTGFPPDAASGTDRIRALMMAAHHERLDVVDALLAAGTDVDVVDPTWHRHPLRLAASDGRPRAVAHLLARGADPALRDERGRTALDLCREGARTHPGDPGFAAVETLLAGR